MNPGQERVMWNPARSMPAREVEFSDPEVAGIKAAIEARGAYGAAADRQWLEPVFNLRFPAGAG